MMCTSIRTIRLTLLFFLLCFAGLSASAQAASAASPSEQQMKALADAQQWDELARLLTSAQQRSAEMDFYYGLALAQLGRLDDAKQALQQGQKLAPADPRFLTELAGLAFKQKQNERAERLLRNALRLSPHDNYINDFLGTLYFLDGNLEAALKFWNRVNKPQVAAVHTDPQLRIAPALLDHAFAFAPASTLTSRQLFDTRMRLSGLGVFPQREIDLGARDDGRFDATLRARERNGFGDGIWESAFLFFRGIPFQQVSPSYYNFRRQAINFDSMFRWDAQKRRVFAELSGPLEHGAKYRWQLRADLRNENWALRNGFAGPAPVLASFNLRTGSGSIDVASYASSHVGWRVGAEISHRDLRSVAPGKMLSRQLLAAGYELKQQAEIRAVLWRVPERRFQLNAGATGGVARLWSPNPENFEKLTGSIGWQWFPQARGDDYATAQTVRAGKTFGQAPFDELFILGLERDNDLLMRAHIGTRDGRKGSAPLGSEYFQQNWELDKNLYSNGLVAVKLGPFVDIGKISDPGGSLGSQKWLFDTGAQLKLRVFGSGLVFSFGKDLRTGNNAFYLRLLDEGHSR
jgi:tetratricopeptide (TPR) repeat protein